MEDRYENNTSAPLMIEKTCADVAALQSVSREWRDESLIDNMEMFGISCQKNKLRIRYINVCDDISRIQGTICDQNNRLYETIINLDIFDIDSKQLLENLLSLTESSDHAITLSHLLLTQFHTIENVIGADHARLKYQYNLSAKSLNLIKLIHNTLKFVLREKIEQRPILNSAELIKDYMKLIFNRSDVEELHVFYLDSSIRIIRDEVFARGTINHAPLYPRELIRRSLEMGATGLIISHNHPSGNPRPSRADKKITRELKMALELVGIKLIDHIIIGHDTYISFRRQGLLHDRISI